MENFTCVFLQLQLVFLLSFADFFFFFPEAMMGRLADGRATTDESAIFGLGATSYPFFLLLILTNYCIKITLGTV